jgi:tetratricopeptide (TPR) repeat protein
MDRARTRHPRTTPSEAELSRVDALTAAVECVPLALELAAARLDVMNAEELLQRLVATADNGALRLDILGNGLRDADPRHRSIPQALEETWARLAEDEQLALAQCAVFAASFGLDAAEHVLDLTKFSTRPVVHVLERLHDESMLQRFRSDGRGSRFALYKTVRAFALSKLALLGQTEATRARHSSFYQDRASVFVAQRAATATLKREVLTDEQKNLLAAIEHALAVASDAQAPEERLPQSIDALVASDAIAETLGELRPSLELFARAIHLSASADVASPRVARLRDAYARGLQMAGRPTDARSEFDRALDAAKEGNQPRDHARVLLHLGLLCHQQRQLGDARAYYTESLAMHERLGDRRAQARCLGNIGATLHDAAEFEEARARYESALSIFAELGEQRLEGIFLSNLGILEQEQGDYARARERYDGALVLLALAGDRRLLAIARGNLGSLLDEEGQHAEAFVCHNAALASLRSLGDVRSLGLCLGRLGATAAALFRVSEAREHLAQAADVLSRDVDPIALATVKLRGAFLDVALGRQAREQGRTSEADTYARAARAKVKAAVELGRDGTAALVDVSDDARSAVRILERSLLAAESDSTLGRVHLQPALSVGHDALWYQPPDGERVVLTERHAVRRILRALLEKHAAGAGGSNVDELSAAGWPGEKATPDAWRNRVYVALSYLRSRGLRRYLLRDEAGYHIDAQLRVRRLPAGPA